jgi:hypothetical protein
MPKGDRSILKADPEDGTTPISNLLLEALAMAHLSGEEKGAVLFLWRRTYGWEEGERRKIVDEISLKEWALALDTSERYAGKVIQSLSDKMLIIRKGEIGKVYNYQMNTRVAEWDGGVLNCTELTERYRQGLSKKYTPVCTKMDTPSDTNSASPKESINKSKENIYTTIFDLWNSQGINEHQKLTSNIKQAIDSALNDFSQEQVCQAIINYAEIIIHPETYFFSHKWTLKDFLNKGVEKFLKRDVAQQNYLKSKPSAKGFNQAGQPFKKMQKPPNRYEEN